MIPMQPWEIEGIHDLSSQREQLKLRDLAQDATAAKRGWALGSRSVCLQRLSYQSCVMPFQIHSKIESNAHKLSGYKYQQGIQMIIKKSIKIVLLMVR